MAKQTLTAVTIQFLCESEDLDKTIRFDGYKVGAKGNLSECPRKVTAKWLAEKMPEGCETVFVMRTYLRKGGPGNGLSYPESVARYAVADGKLTLQHRRTRTR